MGSLLASLGRENIEQLDQFILPFIDKHVLVSHSASLLARSVWRRVCLCGRDLTVYRVDGRSVKFNVRLLGFSRCTTRTSQHGLRLSCVGFPGWKARCGTLDLSLTRAQQEQWLEVLEGVFDTVLTSQAYISSTEIVMGGPIGMGSTGPVHLAKWQGTMVALKQLLPVAESQEASILSHISHPCLLEFYGITALPIQGQLVSYMVAEFCAGGTLKDYLHEVGMDGAVLGPRAADISEHVFIRMARELACGLAYLHDMNVIHRDLKPDNILLDGDLHVKIADLSASCRFVAHETHMRTNVGSIVWAAPETLVDDKYATYDRSCDIYSLGIILWEMWTREEPFHDIKKSWTLRKMIVEKKARPPIDPSWPQPLSTLIKWCWSDIPAARPLAVQVHLCLHDHRLLLRNPDDHMSKDLCRNMRRESIRLKMRHTSDTRTQAAASSQADSPAPPSLSPSQPIPRSHQQQRREGKVVRVGSPPAVSHPETGLWTAMRRASSDEGDEVEVWSDVADADESGMVFVQGPSQWEEESWV